MEKEKKRIKRGKKNKGEKRKTGQSSGRELSVWTEFIVGLLFRRRRRGPCILSPE